MKRILSYLAMPATAITISSTLFAISVTTLLTGCVTFERSPRSGYASRETESSFARDRKSYEKSKAASELGLADSNDWSDEQSEAIETRSFLKKAEKYIEGRRDRDQYFKNKPYMKNDRERLEFLKLGSYDARQRWLDARGIQGSGTHHSAEIQALIDQNDITIGMTKQAVRDAWGEPENVEVAGNPVYGNERWQYSEQITSSEGYQTERRLVYFEAGRVIGWEKN